MTYMTQKVNIFSYTYILNHDTAVLLLCGVRKNARKIEAGGVRKVGIWKK